MTIMVKFGYCFAINPDPKLYTINNDINFIEILLDAEVNDNGDVSNPRNGFFIALHEGDVIGNSNGFFLSPGKAVSIEINPIKFNATSEAKELKYTERKCIFEGEFELMTNYLNERYSPK